MTTIEAASPPKVKLTRAQWVRMIVVAIFAAFSVARVVPDLVRLIQPLGIFGYVTDGNGVVDEIPPPAKGSDVIRIGDRVRVDRIPRFDRKPGIAEVAFTRENFDRHLPVERDGRLRVLHLVAQPEPLPSRIGVLVRILVYIASVALGSILYLIKPGIATFGFFIFCLGGEYPTTYADVLLDNPWRQLPIWIGDTLRGAARAGLLLFAGCLLVRSPRGQRLLAAATAAAGLLAGTLHAYGHWLLVFAARPALGTDRAYAIAANAFSVLIVAALVTSWIRARGIERQRTGYIVAGFFVAGAARLASDLLFPEHIPLWVNSILQSTTIVPIVAVWVAVVRHHFFDVDFVVSRAVVYVALTGAVIGTITVAEELGTYIFYNNTDFAYGVLIAVSMAVGAFTGKIRTAIDHLVDRFIFRDRHAQRIALDLIGGYILDAETQEEVHRALLEDATHALNLSFGGILTRREDGSYEVEHAYAWPEDCVRRLEADDELTRTIARARGALTFTGSESRLIRRAFPHERLTFAAPIFVERDVHAIVVYGHNVSGLDLDPDERAQLVRVVSNASLALTAIELTRYRLLAERAALSVPRPDSG